MRYLVRWRSGLYRVEDTRTGESGCYYGNGDWHSGRLHLPKPIALAEIKRHSEDMASILPGYTPAGR